MKKTKLVYTTYIRSTSKKTWDAISKPEFTRQYWGGMTNVSDWKKGAKWEHLNPDNEVWITGEVVESTPPKRLVLTWADPDDLKDRSRVTFEIEPVEDMVCLTVTHDNFKAGSKMAEKVSGGWPRVLSSMKTFLETGKGLNIFCKSRTTEPKSRKENSMENKEFIYATFIRTTPEKLWEALTNGDFSEKYWFGFRIEVELKAGGTVRILPPKGMEQHGDHKGKVLVCEPGRKLVYTWQQNDPPEIARKRDGLSRVTYELTPMGPQVKFRLIHENLLPEDVEQDPNTFKGINNGWPAVISSLKSLLETGEPIAFAAGGCSAKPAESRA